MIKNVPFERPTAETLEALRGLPSAAVYDALMAEGIVRCFIDGPRTMTPGNPIVGPALTIRYLPTREDLLPKDLEERTTFADFQALELVQPGDVLVFDAGGLAPAAVLGDVFITRLKVRGAVGVVVDGYVRDIHELRASGLAVYARGCNVIPVTPRVIPAEINVPVQCGGVTILPGDLILTDDDGAVVIPKTLAMTIAEHAREKEELEGFIREQLLANPEMPPGEIYPPRDKTREAYRKAKLSN
jgi:regulator of RNase E activity RraA